MIEGHHDGYGTLRHLGPPTGKRVQVMGMSWAEVHDELPRFTKLGKGQKALALARRLRVHEERNDDARAAERMLAEREKPE